MSRDPNAGVVHERRRRRSQHADAPRPLPRPARPASRAEEALKRAALAVSSAGGPQVYASLITELAEILQVDVAFVAVFNDVECTQMSTLAAWLDGRLLRNFDYELAGSPCAQVVGREFRYVAQGVAGEFQPGSLFGAKGMDCYAAYPLFSAAGESLGLLVTMSRAPMPDPALAESILKIFAVRIAAEIARKRAEDALRQAALAVSGAEGADVFRELVHALATILGTDIAFIALPKADSPCHLRMLAFYMDGRISENFEYPIAGTPCEQILQHGYCAYADRLPERFPDDEDFKTMGAESYAGLPLVGPDGSTLGIISVVSRKRLPNPELAESMLKIFAARALNEIERARAEEALRSAEASYRAIFEAAEDPIFVHEWDTGAIVDVNPAACAVYGYTHDEMMRVTLDDLSSGVPPYTAAEGLRRIEEAKRNGATQFQWHRKNRDGTLRWDEVRLKCAVIGGQPRVLAATRDITERKLAEERLRASEERYRMLFEMESDAIVLVDAATLALVDANRAAETLWGYPRDELLTLKATDLSIEAEETLSAVHQGIGEFKVPLRWHRRRDGSVFPVEINANRIELAGRTIVLAAIRDITERRSREEALARSEGRLRATVEAAFDCVIGMDSRGNVVEFNQAAEQAFGHRREDVLGRPLASVVIPPRLRAAHEAGLARFRQYGAGPFIGRRVETTAMRADGSEFPVELAIRVARAGEDDIFVGYLRDITERKQAEAKRAELEAQLRQAQKMEAIGHLTGGIAHDFNNILQSIVGYVVLATERKEELGDERLGRYLAQVRIAAQRASDLIRQMLTFSRGQRGERRPLSPVPLVAEASRMLRSTLPSSISLDTESAPAVPAVLVDPIQLEQVLLNLCINARDAMRNMGEITVSTRAVSIHESVCASCRQRVSGTFVELAVRDSGPGIPSAVAERMFEPFFTTKEVGKGSGMGLAMVHGIVHDHGGHILVDSAPAAGTTIRVLFQALESSSAAPIECADERRAVRPKTRLHGSVLVADDEATVLELMRDLLTGWGLDVALAQTGLEAAATFSAEPDRFDLVLTDHTMPGMTGVALAREITRLRPGVPILLCTGFGEDLSEQAVSGAGICAVARKPVEPGELHKLLSRHLVTVAPGA